MLQLKDIRVNSNLRKGVVNISLMEISEDWLEEEELKEFHQILIQQQGNCYLYF